MDSTVIWTSAVLGLLLGSFANVVIHRVPLGQSVVQPPSACPHCGRSVRGRDNVPVVSWLLLRGRCRDCGLLISARYPAVELAMAALFAAAAWRVGLTWLLPAVLLLVWTLLVLALIDLDTRRIPNKLTYPLTPVLLALATMGALVEGAPEAALRALLGGVVAGGLLLLLALISPRGMGMGDVKLAAFIGIGLGVLGWAEVAVGLLAAFALGGVSGLLLLATRRRGRKDLIPFGPFLALGALIGLLWGDALVTAYLDTLSL